MLAIQSHLRYATWLAGETGEVSVTGKKVPKTPGEVAGGGGGGAGSATSGTTSAVPTDSMLAVSSEGASGAGGTV